MNDIVHMCLYSVCTPDILIERSPGIHRDMRKLHTASRYANLASTRLAVPRISVSRFKSYSLPSSRVALPACPFKYPPPTFSPASSSVSLTTFYYLEEQTFIICIPLSFHPSGIHSSSLGLRPILINHPLVHYTRKLQPSVAIDYFDFLTWLDQCLYVLFNQKFSRNGYSCSIASTPPPWRSGSGIPQKIDEHEERSEQWYT